MYRSEHPKPQFQRDSWLNLNGEWLFTIDNGLSGEARGLHRPEAEYDRVIQVPFCPESRLSGVEHTDFMNAVWYKRTITLEEGQLNGRVLLHFGAVDYHAIIYVNGQKCGEHKGGYSSFYVDITEQIQPGENTLTVQAQDDTRDRLIPSGKQCHVYHSGGCHYTRTTGIWQTVWLEFVPQTRIVKARYTPDAENGSLHILAEVTGSGVLTAEASYEGRPMGAARVETSGNTVSLHLPLAETHLWEVGCGRLYDLTLTYGDDRVNSYFGLRSLQVDGYKFRINGKSVFQRTVLDQGFYPDGIYTAPSDRELEQDIHRSIEMGFNGARLHEKVFEERFLYHCDRLGYLVWGEYPNWGLDHTYEDSIYSVLPEWLEILERDGNHPAIVGWCPFNETWDIAGRKQYDPLLELVYRTTKAVDPTRPCIDVSGAYHVVTDLFDVHDYTQNPADFAAHFDTLPLDGTFYDPHSARETYPTGQALFVSEYGGIAWNMDGNGWGYGNAPASPEEFLSRLKGLTDALLDNPCIMGLCYTQLTDVEQEQNGLYTYQRQAKFDPAVIQPIFARKAAIEEE